jgi:hypothetical protein
MAEQADRPKTPDINDEDNNPNGDDGNPNDDDDSDNVNGDQNQAAPNPGNERDYRTRSRASSTRSSKNSHLSTASQALMKQKAKAEAAKVRHQFAIREAELARQEAELNLHRTLLRSECNVKQAEVELQVLEELLEEDENRSRALNFFVEEPETGIDRVQQYLMNNMAAGDDIRSDMRPKSREDMGQTSDPMPLRSDDEKYQTKSKETYIRIL